MVCALRTPVLASASRITPARGSNTPDTSRLIRQRAGRRVPSSCRGIRWSAGGRGVQCSRRRGRPRVAQRLRGGGAGEVEGGGQIAGDGPAPGGDVRHLDPSHFSRKRVIEVWSNTCEQT